MIVPELLNLPLSPFELAPAIVMVPALVTPLIVPATHSKSVKSR